MEHLLWNQDGDYTLTERGEALIQRILSDNLVLDYEHGQVQR
ncbi:hypothetical protein SAMN05216285_3854 [Natrinema salifodinae]|uniref:Uncharacterized protein n=1 Tax=Natrinema salifodinae TaxID=1202768 RepID=A0A1I0QT54_9EURY|nr:hypothetical protein SAMN05216285_3854 [Natrinema salifodinae]